MSRDARSQWQLAATRPRAGDAPLREQPRFASIIRTFPGLAGKIVKIT
jgi:hypothetical protein